MIPQRWNSNSKANLSFKIPHFKQKFLDCGKDVGKICVDFHSKRIASISFSLEKDLTHSSHSLPEIT